MLKLLILGALTIFTTFNNFINDRFYSGYGDTNETRITSLNQIPHYNTLLTSYFGNLLNGFEVNDDSSCIRIATSMVLGFYDVMFSDDIINDGFDLDGYADYTYDLHGNVTSLSFTNESPGVAGPYDGTKKRQYQNALPNGMLMKNIGTYGYYPEYTIPDFTRDITTGDYFTTTFDNYNEIQGSISLSETLDYILEGIPVIVNYRPHNSSMNHCVVAFDYCNGNLICHNGYNLQNEEHFSTFISLPAEDFFEFCVILPNEFLVHKCTNNLYDTNGNNICSCMLSSFPFTLLNHEHSFTYYDEHSHTSICSETNASALNEHLYKIVDDSITMDNHTVKCICGHEKVINHNVVSYNNISNQGHKVIFDDGCELFTNHEISRYEVYGSDVHRVYCECGAYDIESHFIDYTYYFENGYVEFCRCGYYHPYGSVDYNIIEEILSMIEQGVDPNEVIGN